MGKVIRNYDNEGNLISKECTRCHKIKPVSEFYKNTRMSDGVQGKCKECERKYKQDNAEKIKKYKKQYYKDNIETIKEHQKQYQKDNLVHNIKSNKYYVGQTIRAFDIRYPSGWLYEHGYKNAVKEDLELYGENSFKYTKLFKVAHSQYELDKLVAYYIDYYDSYENGYNENRGYIFTDRGKEI